MRKIKVLLTAVIVMFSMSYSMAAKSEGSSSERSKGEVEVLTKAEFLKKVFNYEVNTSEWKYEGDKPCIIDFYADWCGPCKQIAPILQELASHYKDDIVVYKIDTDKERELAAAFGVQALPTLLFIPAEGKPQIAQGALPKEELIKLIDTFLLKKK